MSQDPVHEALSLDFDATRINRYYEGWAAAYDDDVDRAGYQAPAFIAELSHSLLSAAGILPSDALIIDAACGTGLVGRALAKHGYSSVVGLDLCPEMADIARATNTYSAVSAGIDLSNVAPPVWRGRADLVVCCGAFTQGHLRPSAVSVLADLVKPGGTIVVSTRASYADTEAFEQACERFATDGLRLVDCLRDAPYLDEENAHYWVLVVDPGLATAQRMGCTSGGA